MAQAVHVVQSGPSSVAFVDPHLLHVVAVAGDQGATAGKKVGTVEDFPLSVGADRDNSLPASLGPAALQELGGWSDIRMAQRYAHLAPEHLSAYAGNISGLRGVTGTLLATPQNKAVVARN